MVVFMVAISAIYDPPDMTVAQKKGALLAYIGLGIGCFLLADVPTAAGQAAARSRGRLHLRPGRAERRQLRPGLTDRDDGAEPAEGVVLETASARAVFASSARWRCRAGRLTWRRSARRP